MYFHFVPNCLCYSILSEIESVLWRLSTEEFKMPLKVSYIFEFISVTIVYDDDSCFNAHKLLRTSIATDAITRTWWRNVLTAWASPATSAWGKMRSAMPVRRTAGIKAHPSRPAQEIGCPLERRGRTPLQYWPLQQTCEFAICKESFIFQS